MTAVEWGAAVAPLGVPSPDGRVLDEAAILVLPRFPSFAFLAYFDTDGERRRIGRVHTLETRDGWVWAAGELWATPTNIPDRMRSGQLRPEMDLIHTQSYTDGDQHLRFTTATLASIVAGTSPAWPDTRFILEES